MELANDVLLAQLLSLGLELKQARAAVAAGNTTVEQATEWIFENNNQIDQQLSAGSSSATTTSTGALRLRPTEDMDDLDLQKAIELSTAPQEPAKAPPTTQEKKPIKINIIRAGQASSHASTPSRQPNPPSSSSTTSAAVSAGSSSSTSSKREREPDTSAASSGVTPLLPLISSRQKEAEFEAENARLKKEAEQLAEKSKKFKQLEREARQRALQAIREDREKLKSRQISSVPTQSAPQPSPSSSSPAGTSTSMATSERTTTKTTTMVQLRLKNGTVLKRSFDSNAPLQQVFDTVFQEDSSIGQNITLIQPFPRREFSLLEAQQTLREAGLCPSCSLIVHLPPSASSAPLSPPSAANPSVSMPGSWHAGPQPLFGQIGGHGPEPMDIDDEEDEDYDDNGDDNQDETSEDENSDDHDEEDDEGDEDMAEDDGLMHILPVGHGHGHGPPFGGRGRGRGGIWAGRGGRGRGGMPFSGVGHRLSSGSVSTAGAAESTSSSVDGGDIQGTSSSISDSERRRRVWDAMMARVAQQLTTASASSTLTTAETSPSLTSPGAARSESHKSVLTIEIPSLLSRCTYEVAELRELRVLCLSNTKVTSQGIARTVSKSVWKEQLHTLDLSFCEGIQGPAVLIQVQELLNIHNLRLNSTRAFDSGPILVPDSLGFTKLQELDLARTLISDEDLIAIRSCFPSLEHLNLTGCSQLSDASLESLCMEGEKRMPELSVLKFPNRQSTLQHVLPLAAEQFEQLSQLDLTGFLNITDETILSLGAAVNLTVLSLAGSKLTDVGSPVIANFSLLREINLDRTLIQDKSMEHFRGLGRLEIISLSHCVGLTVEGIKILSMSASFERTLKQLNLGHNPDIHDGALPYIEQAHSLVMLNLDYTDVTDARARRLMDTMDALDKLRFVGVTEGERLKERGVYFIASSMLNTHGGGGGAQQQQQIMQMDDDDDDDDDD
ncbi:hypothetical protein BGW42_000018 [Actinomortierella wolfii]|nr:hypothetical protein BGW42_000018 [Actinomortierella wolfii]